MQESYSEELATHTGPESCAQDGNIVCEALTGVRAGRVLSFEIAVNVPSADGIPRYGRQYRMHRSGEMCTDSAESKTPRMYGNTLSGNRDPLCWTLFALRPAWRTHNEARP